MFFSKHRVILLYIGPRVIFDSIRTSSIHLVVCYSETSDSPVQQCDQSEQTSDNDLDRHDVQDTVTFASRDASNLFAMAALEHKSILILCNIFETTKFFPNDPRRVAGLDSS